MKGLLTESRRSPPLLQGASPLPLPDSTRDPAEEKATPEALYYMACLSLIITTCIRGNSLQVAWDPVSLEAALVRQPGREQNTIYRLFIVYLFTYWFSEVGLLCVVLAVLELAL